jgi:antitoxin (DNA-binding transcriptional repressor) of toxin-antitoxin stability system
MEPIPMEKAQRQLPTLIRAALLGEEVVITAEDAREVRLVPVKPVGPTRRFGSAKGLIEMAEDFDEPLEDFREYEE